MTPVFFSDYSSMIILIEKEIREMNLGKDRVIEIIFFTSICGLIEAGISSDFVTCASCIFCA